MTAADPKRPLIIENNLDFIGYDLSRGALTLAAQTAEKQALYIDRPFEQQRTKKATPTEVASSRERMQRVSNDGP